jgi:large subunit ribosomal protein L25
VAAITLKANIRDYKGRSKSNSARRAGKVPGVFYLGNSKNIPIEVEALALRHLVYTSETHIIDLELNDGSKEMAVLREVQFDPITDKMMHFDLIGVVKGQLMKFEVPVVLEGVPAGVRDGAVLTQTVHKVEVECLPRNLPNISPSMSHRWSRAIPFRSAISKSTMSTSSQCWMSRSRSCRIRVRRGNGSREARRSNARTRSHRPRNRRGSRGLNPENNTWSGERRPSRTERTRPDGAATATRRHRSRQSRSALCRDAAQYRFLVWTNSRIYAVSASFPL